MVYVVEKVRLEQWPCVPDAAEVNWEQVIQGSGRTFLRAFCWIQTAARLKPKDNKPARPETCGWLSVNKSWLVGRLPACKLGRIMGEEQSVSGSISAPGEMEEHIFVFAQDKLSLCARDMKLTMRDNSRLDQIYKHIQYSKHTGAAFHFVHAIWNGEVLILQSKYQTHKCYVQSLKGYYGK